MSKEKWKHLEELEKEIEGIEVKFKLKDLWKLFQYFDRYWCQVNLEKGIVCISHEGYNYEPLFKGKLIKMRKKTKNERGIKI